MPQKTSQPNPTNDAYRVTGYLITRPERTRRIIKTTVQAANPLAAIDQVCTGHRLIEADLTAERCD